MEYLQILFEHITVDQKEVLVARLSDIGFDGFEEEENILKAYTSSKKIDEILFNKIIEKESIKFTKSIIKEENWNEFWESNFEPVMVYHPKTNEPFAFIRAHFHNADSAFLHDISITPKMSFGTGHHATTHLMVAHMSEIDFQGKSVIDFGTGTGVLAILAEKLRAETILGIDNDDWSINNALENISVNNCKNITLLKAETILSETPAQIILANINLNVIKENIDTIINAADNNATFLFSGIMLHDENIITSVLQIAGLNILHVNKKDGWLLLHANK